MVLNIFVFNVLYENETLKIFCTDVMSWKFFVHHPFVQSVLTQILCMQIFTCKIFSNYMYCSIYNMLCLFSAKWNVRVAL